MKDFYSQNGAGKRNLNQAKDGVSYCKVTFL